MIENTYTKHFRDALFNTTKKIVRTENFPIDGITFLDWFPIMRNINDYRLITRGITEEIMKVVRPWANCALGVEARGFLLMPPIAERLNNGMVVSRRPNKLAGDIIQFNQKTEYGENMLAIKKGSTTGKKVLIIDDVFATMGTVQCVEELIRKDGGEVVGVAGLIDLLYCDKVFTPSYPVISLFSLNAPDGEFTFTEN